MNQYRINDIDALKPKILDPNSFSELGFPLKIIEFWRNINK